VRDEQLGAASSSAAPLIADSLRLKFRNRRLQFGRDPLKVLGSIREYVGIVIRRRLRHRAFTFPRCRRVSDGEYYAVPAGWRLH